MKRKSLTPAERQERLDAAHARLAESVQSLQTSHEWMAYLKVMARFHRYSFGNTLMIFSQRPDATQVAGFTTWKSMGRSVRKGAKGIMILAPCISKVGEKVTDGKGEAPDKTEPLKVLRGFRLAYVFDISDTEGEELPSVGAPLIEGEAPEGMTASLEAQIELAGFTLEYVDEIEGHQDANGITDFGTLKVSIARNGRSDASQARTLAHELAHVLLHGDRQSTREIAEVEAESVAFLISENFGLAADGYSVPYIANWGASEPEALKLTATRVLATAHQIITQIEGEAGEEGEEAVAA